LKIGNCIGRSHFGIYVFTGITLLGQVFEGIWNKSPHESIAIAGIWIRTMTLTVKVKSLENFSNLEDVGKKIEILV
jgi:hypothetical protein